MADRDPGAPAPSILTVHGARHHGWDRDLAPARVVAPGDRIAVRTADASGGQITPASGEADLRTLDPGRVNPLTGPIAIDGAAPGDAVVVRIREAAPARWGWTGNIPGFGLLADRFPDPALHVWRYDPAAGVAEFGPGGRVPLKPMIGTIGLAPGTPGVHDVIPPRRVGGNMDLRDVGPGAELWLPVEVDGGLLSLGDGHAAQGDGEVCGTGIETPMEVEIEVDLVRAGAPPFPRLRLAGPVTHHLDASGYEVTTGIGPDLMQGARDAVSSMVDLLCTRHGLDAVHAYLLCSVCADLRVSEIVDAPNWVVSLYFPRVVLE